jgi:hypothetical protein
LHGSVCCDEEEVMMKDEQMEKQIAAARANAEGLLQHAVSELRKLVAVPKEDAVKWFPHGIDGIKISIKVYEVEASLELEGAVASSAVESDDET